MLTDPLVPRVIPEARLPAFDLSRIAFCEASPIERPLSQPSAMARAFSVVDAPAFCRAAIFIPLTMSPEEAPPVTFTMIPLFSFGLLLAFFLLKTRCHIHLFF
jgi:hypothetical protein